MYIIEHRGQEILYIPDSVLLLFLSLLMLTIYLIVLKIVLMNVRLWLEKLFSMLALMKMIDRNLCLLLLWLLEILLFSHFCIFLLCIFKVSSLELYKK